ncbi:PorV/PorQ family protein [candidate division KSB1 bacterium]|nr:PorV/PorQ family protein [candidate division KSB1 bacterium]
MKRRVLGISILLVFITVATVQAQFVSDVTKVAITAAPFLEIGVGARAMGMGGAYVANADESSALYWNPGGIARIANPEGIFVHMNWIADISFDYIGFVLPAGRIGSFGLSITSLSMDDMMVRTEDRPQGTGEYFKSGSMALGLTYALNLTDRFSIGFSGKYIREEIWNESAQGMAIDIGTLFTTGFHGMRIGASLTNFGTDLRMSGEDLVRYHDIDGQKLGNNDEIYAELKTDSWPMPLNFQVGIAMELIENDIHRITFALDAIQPTDNKESLNLGIEYGLRKWLFLRAGYRSLFLEDNEEGLTAGAGANLGFFYNLPFRFDYAYADFGRLESIHCFTIALEL